MRKALLAAVIVCGALVSGTAASAEPTERDRAAARALGDEGVALWKKQDYARALDRFTRALELVQAPTLALRQAQCLEKLGRWVEASEKMLALGRTSLEPNAPPAFRQAVAEAWRQGQEVANRIPKLVVVLDGPDTESAEVTLDGRAVPRALWGVGQPVDPGNHEVRAVMGERRASERVTLSGREEKRVVLRLADAAEEPAAPAPAAPDPPAGPAPIGPREEPARDTISTNRTWGWVAIGVGAAGTAAGAAMWGMAKGKQGDLEDAGCRDGRCPLGAESDLDSYRGLRTGAYLGLGVGAVGLIGGSVLLFTSGGDQTSAGVRPWIGVGRVGVGGRY